MQFISYLFFMLLVGIFAIIPFPVLYAISNFFAFLMNKVFGYRKGIILKNLAYAFPEKTEQERRSYLKEIYRNFTDIVIESIKASSVPLQKINARYKFIPTEEYLRISKNGNGSVVFAAHYTNWEWGTMTLESQTPYHVIGLIKPINNKYIHNFIANSRSKVGTGLVSIYGSKEALTQSYDQPTSIVFIADQNPSNKEKAHHINFFNKHAVALQGGSNFAFQNPERSIWFYRIDRIKRGYYTVRPILLGKTASDFNKPEELTQSYFNALEVQIRENPAYWLWTHKRWKAEFQY